MANHFTRGILWLLAGVLISPFLLFGATCLALKTGYLKLDARVSSTPFETHLARTARRIAAEREVQRLKCPLTVDEENIQTGAIYYREYCAQCHGGSASPSSLAGAVFNPAPPRLEAMDRVAPEELFFYVKKGIRVTGMPSFHDILSDEAIWQITLFVQKQRENPGARELLSKDDYVQTSPVEYIIDGKPVK